MTVFVIDIGIDTNAYGKYSLPLIEKLCQHNNVNFFVLRDNITQNIYNNHPSWLKLFMHELIDDDFIIAWDLDLVPTRLFNIHEHFNNSVLNLAYDEGYIAEKFTFNGKFKYNCGLMGVPRILNSTLKELYNKTARIAQYPSYEQYYVNDTIHDNNIEVNLLTKKLNHIHWSTDDVSHAYNIHYTGRIPYNTSRFNLIKKHYEIYNENFK